MIARMSRRARIKLRLAAAIGELTRARDLASGEGDAALLARINAALDRVRDLWAKM